MFSQTSSCARLLALSCLLDFAAPRRLPAQTYTITELPPLTGDTYCGAYALNESGQAAGYSGDRAVIWTDGAPGSIHTLIASWSVAFALNDSGHAAGDVSTSGTNSGAFIWRGNTMERIIPPSGQLISEAYAMNNAGVVVGPGGSASFGYRWQAGTFQSLGVLTGDHTARPLAINNWGQIAGASIGPGGRRPATWVFTSAQSVPTPAGGTGYGQAWGINDLGQVVGEFYTPAGTRPFLWSSALGAQDLPLPAGTTSGLAWAINDGGTIIGDADGQVAIWRKDASGVYAVTLLATLLPGGSGWERLSLYAINEAGQIAGEGLFNGQSRGFILNPQLSSSLSVLAVNRDDPFSSWDSAAALPVGAPVHAGTQAGDLVAFRAITSRLSPNYKWSAQLTDNLSTQGITGPEGTDASEWRMDTGDFNWPPGNYTVRCEINQGGSPAEILNTTLSVGWRTDEYLVIGQVKHMDDFALDMGRRDAVRSALINSYHVPKESFLVAAAKDTLSVLSLEFNLKLWTAHQFFRYTGTDMSAAPAFVRLPGVSTKERLWMVQTLLNEFPDETVLPLRIELSHLTELRTQRSYRMYGRIQIRYQLAADGAIDPASVVALRQDWDNGPTKFAQPPELLMPTGKIAVRGVEFDLNGNSNQSFISSEPLPGSGAVTLAVDHRALSFYFGGRVGLEGRVPNYALFNKDAPFIFTEIIFALGPDGRDTQSRIRMSIDKVWSPTGVSGNNHFNEIRIFRRSLLIQGANRPFVLEGEFLIRNQLEPFIQSGSTVWPGMPPDPTVQ